MGYMNNDGLLYFWTKLKTIFVRTVNGNGPDANGNVSVSVPSASSTSPKMDGTATVGSETAYARGDHIHPTDTSRAASSHTHGNITNAGALQTTDITIANGDKIVVTDASNSNKVARTSIAFDGSTETQALSKKGTWVSFAAASHSHGFLQNDGTVNSGPGGIVSGDRLAILVSDQESSPTFKLARSPLVFDGSSDNMALSKKGTWVNISKGNAGLFYGTCSTSTSNVAKTITCAEFTSSDLVAGTLLLVKFSTSIPIVGGDTYMSFNVNSTGAHNVDVMLPSNSVVAGHKIAWSSNETYLFTYTGSAWLALNTVAQPYSSSNGTVKMDGTASYGSSAYFARGDHVHPTDTTRAPIASPALTGTPTAPTATAGTNNTQIATTAFVTAAISAASSGVASFKGALNASSELEAIITVEAGWYWVVQTAGTYLGQDCEVGDFIYAVQSGSKLNASTPWLASFFAIIQTNITPMTNSEIDAIVAS